MSIGQQNKNNLMFYGAIALVAVLVGGLVFTQMRGKPQNNTMVTYNTISSSSSVTKPLLTDEEIAEFVARSAADILTFEYETYKEDLLDTRNYFTDKGWIDIQRAFEESGMLKEVVERKIDLNSVVTAKPTITAQGVDNGIYSWQLEAPFLMVYAIGSDTVEKRQRLHIRVQRSDSPKNLEHVGIAQIILAPQ